MVYRKASPNFAILLMGYFVEGVNMSAIYSMYDYLADGELYPSEELKKC